ncbi:GNAT family N-acetyltransferase [Sphingomonas endolithica]|jgi:RimJ/RimL family protein N-acetyltransferase|uniref:GNAT family N-acetyltransferase n=1 Tax=Sphingomonas endolithica TaxID=2972485 RepID=UPI0021AF6A80|nr:GNAT family N-acetyltransferase [Sphingomonas sp. ZFBP2030]
MFARTKRLTLRPGWPEDAPALAAAIGHEQVVDKLAHVPWPYGLEDAAGFLGMAHPPREPRFLVFESPTETPRLVGGAGIHAQEYGGEYQLGYWLTPDAWGRGYATEVGQQLVDIARYTLGLQRLHAFHFVDNPASGRVLTKLGFRTTGRIEPRHSRARGGTAPAALFELDLDPGGQCEERLAA